MAKTGSVTGHRISLTSVTLSRVSLVYSQRISQAFPMSSSAVMYAEACIRLTFWIRLFLKDSNFSGSRLYRTLSVLYFDSAECSLLKPALERSYPLIAHFDNDFFLMIVGNSVAVVPVPVPVPVPIVDVIVAFFLISKLLLNLLRIEMRFAGQFLFIKFYD